MDRTDRTFCFTDIEGSTAILRALGEAHYEAVLERHRELVRSALAASGGEEIQTEGDGFFVAFSDASSAVAFAAAAQRAIAGEPWPIPVRVRMGMHSGPATRRADGNYMALAVHQAARVGAVAHGGQVLLSDVSLAAATMPPGVRARRLGAHRLRDFEGPVEVAQLVGDGLPDGFPPLRAARADHGLRIPRTSLVGRDDELNELTKLLANQPVVTLVGIGGVGKTRLALEAAAAVAASFPDGLHVVELSSADGPLAVDSNLSAGVGVRPEPGVETIDAVAATIGTGRRLLILDSCERNLDRVAYVIDHLVNVCPNLVVLSTSLEAIRIPDERLVPVEPLGFNLDRGGTGAFESDAVRLIVQRAIAAGARLVPTDEELGQVAEIARRLDGIPLALELVAGRIAERGLSTVLQALDDRFSLLTNGYRTALPRHRTLEATVAWSVEQLKPEAASLLARLSVLLGRWEPAGAAQVCGDDDNTRYFLQQLIDRSLVVVDDETPQRVRLLATVRAFGVRSLSDGDLADLAVRRTAWLNERFESLQLASEDEFITELDALGPDVRAALTLEQGEPVEPAASLAGYTAAWFELRGWWTEAITVLTNLIERCPPGSARANAQAGLCQLLALAGRAEEAHRMAAEVVAEPAATPKARALALVASTPLGQPPPTDAPDPLQQALDTSGPMSPIGLGARARMALRKQILGDADGAALDLAAIVDDALAAGRMTIAAQHEINLGAVLARLGRLDEAEQHLEAGRKIANDRHNAAIAAGALTNLSLIHLHRGDATGALRFAEERLALARQTSQPRGVAVALSAISNAAMALNDFERATAAATECLQLCRKLHFHEGIATSGFNLSVMASERSDVMALSHAVELLGDVATMGNVSFEALALFAAGGVLCSAGSVVGAELIASAEAATQELVPLDPADRVWLGECEARLVEAVGADLVAAARERGGATDLATARATALSALKELSGSERSN